MRFKKSPQLPGAGRTRAWHYRGSHMPTSPGAILLSKMACQPKHFGLQCTYENGGSIYESLVKKPLQYSQSCKIKFHQFTNFQFKNSKFFHPNENQAQKMGHEWHSQIYNYGFQAKITPA